jgi:hypothetical protein
VKKFNEIIKNCTNSSNEILEKEDFLVCAELIEFLDEFYWKIEKRKKYKYEILDDADVVFQMISGDDTKKINDKLNEIIKKPRKFICLNDNIDHKLSNDAYELKKLVKQFYSTLFPLPSSFEKSNANNTSVELLATSNNVNDSEIFMFEFMIFLIISSIIIMFICIKVINVPKNIFNRIRSMSNQLLLLSENEKSRKQRTRRKRRIEITRSRKHDSSTESDTDSTSKSKLKQSPRSFVL